MILQILTLVIVLLIWILVANNALRLRRENKKIQQEKLQEKVATEHLAGLKTTSAQIELHQYKGYVIKTERPSKGGGWKYGVFSNDMKSELCKGNTVSDTRSREELLTDIKQLIDTNDRFN